MSKQGKIEYVPPSKSHPTPIIVIRGILQGPPTPPKPFPVPTPKPKGG